MGENENTVTLPVDPTQWAGAVAAEYSLAAERYLLGMVTSYFGHEPSLEEIRKFGERFALEYEQSPIEVRQEFGQPYSTIRTTVSMRLVPKTHGWW